jgi:hypothetical protein
MSKPGGSTFFVAKPAMVIPNAFFTELESFSCDLLLLCTEPICIEARYASCMNFEFYRDFWTHRFPNQQY